jgi:hypothetical protein
MLNVKFTYDDMQRMLCNHSTCFKIKMAYPTKFHQHFVVCVGIKSNSLFSPLSRVVVDKYGDNWGIFQHLSNSFQYPIQSPN